MHGSGLQRGVCSRLWGYFTRSRTNMNKSVKLSPLASSLCPRKIHSSFLQRILWDEQVAVLSTCAQLGRGLHIARRNRERKSRSPCSRDSPLEGGGWRAGTPSPKECVFRRKRYWRWGRAPRLAIQERKSPCKTAFSGFTVSNLTHQHLLNQMLT